MRRNNEIFKDQARPARGTYASLRASRDVASPSDERGNNDPTVTDAGESSYTPPRKTASSERQCFRNQHSRRQFLAMFFGLGTSVWTASKRSGYPADEGQEQIRRLGVDNWRAEAVRNGRAA